MPVGFSYMKGQDDDYGQRQLLDDLEARQTETPTTWNTLDLSRGTKRLHVMEHPKWQNVRPSG